MLCQMSGTEWCCTNEVKEVAGADCWQIVSDSSVGNYWTIEAFQSLAQEWGVFERILYELLNSRCCFCFPKQTDKPPLLKKLNAALQVE